MSKLQRIKVSSGALDVAGEGIGYSNVVRGKILSVHVDYPASGADVVLTSDELVDQTILNLSTSSTDAVYYPRTPIVNNATTNITYDGTRNVHDTFAVFGRLKLAVTGGAVGEEVVLNVLIEEF